MEKYDEVEKDVYVSHFDILGMKATLKKNSWEAWQNILDLSKSLDQQELPITPSERNRLSERYFSDTVIITTEDDSIASLHTIIARSLELFRCALRNGIPLRGGIAHGIWFEKRENHKDLFCGTSLSEAYALGEEQQLLGISVCSTVYSKFCDHPFKQSSERNVILQKDIPVANNNKRCMKSKYILNWPAICGSELKRIKLDDPLSFSQHFWTVNQGNTTLSSHTIKKYENTLRLINDIR